MRELKLFSLKNSRPSRDLNTGTPQYLADMLPNELSWQTACITPVCWSKWTTIEKEKYKSRAIGEKDIIRKSRIKLTKYNHMSCDRWQTEKCKLKHLRETKMQREKFLKINSPQGKGYAETSQIEKLIETVLKSWTI